MKTSSFNYELPESFIAQNPYLKRDESKLLYLNKDSSISHHIFSDIKKILKKDDVLVLNDTKVRRSRIYLNKLNTGAKVEFLFLENENDIWTCLVKPAKKAKIGDIFIYKDLELKIESIGERGIRKVKINYDGEFEDFIEENGAMPLPPYISDYPEDDSYYQTIYAKHFGSSAAPTAGLHFTNDLLEEIKKRGVNISYITLHVGLGTFRPVTTELIENHKMHSEYYFLDKKNAEIINKSKRIICVGTTSIRALESIYNKYGYIREDKDRTDIFMYPGYKFNTADILITNFHLPESTLLMLVSAFCGLEEVLNAYTEAKNNNYKFFSFGDAMIIEKKEKYV